MHTDLTIAGVLMISVFAVLMGYLIISQRIAGRWFPRWMRLPFYLFVTLCNFYVLAELPAVPFHFLLSCLIVYSMVLFVLASEVLKRASNWLTRRRGDRWVKEMDYVYLFLAAVGFVVSINRLEVITNKIQMPDAYGSAIVVTAFVIRALKTHAEINQWNKTPASLASAPVVTSSTVV